MRHFCLEDVGFDSDTVTQAIQSSGQLVSVVNRAAIQSTEARGASKKTGRSHAHQIALFAREEQPEAWQPPTEETADLTDLLRLLSTLREQKVLFENRLKQPISVKLVQDSLENIIAVLEEQIITTLRLISEHIESHPNLKENRNFIDPQTADEKGAAEPQTSSELAGALKRVD